MYGQRNSGRKAAVLCCVCASAFLLLVPAAARAHSHVDDVFPVPAPVPVLRIVDILPPSRIGQVFEYGHAGEVPAGGYLSPWDERDPLGATAPPLVRVGPSPYPEPATLGLLLVAASFVRPRRGGRR